MEILLTLFVCMTFGASVETCCAFADGERGKKLIAPALFGATIGFILSIIPVAASLSFHHNLQN